MDKNIESIAAARGAAETAFGVRRQFLGTPPAAATAPAGIEAPRANGPVTLAETVPGEDIAAGRRSRAPGTAAENVYDARHAFDAVMEPR